MKTLWRPWLLIAADAWFLWTRRPAWAALVRDVTAPRAQLVGGADHFVVHIASALVWLAACWLGVGLIAALLGALPGRCGAISRAISAAVLPRAVHRLLVTVTTGTIALSALSGTAAASDGHASVTVGGQPVATSPSWPTAPPATTAPATTTAATATTGARSVAPSWPTTSTHPSPRAVVQPGDSLWAIAARQLNEQFGRQPSAVQTAAAWPRWYHANRSVIGDDPALLQPGTALVSPDGSNR